MSSIPLPRGGTPEYEAWRSIKRRCLSPTAKHYEDYGGRGITICPKWRDSFPAFLRDVGYRPGPKYSIDRINNNGNYEPGNVRWATRCEQMRNTRVNHLLTANGVTLTVTEWAEKLGVTPATLFARIRTGWPIELTLSTPNLRKGEPAPFRERPPRKQHVRTGPRKGQGHGMAKLSDEQVLEIRTRLAVEKISYRQIGNEFGVSAATICVIVKRRGWVHL